MDILIGLIIAGVSAGLLIVALKMKKARGG